MQNNDYNKNLCVLCDENNNRFNLIVHKSEINLIKQLDIN